MGQPHLTPLTVYTLLLATKSGSEKMWAKKRIIYFCVDNAVILEYFSSRAKRG